MYLSLVTLLCFWSLSTQLGSHARAIHEPPFDISIPKRNIDSIVNVEKRGPPGVPASLPPKPPTIPGQRPPPSRPQPNRPNPGNGGASVCARGLRRRADEDEVESDEGDSLSEESWEDIYTWLDIRAEKLGIDKSKIIFYTGAAGKEMAKAFVDNNKKDGYNYFHSILSDEGLPGDEFQKLFLPDRGDAFNKAASKALGLWARDPLVFNHDKAEANSFWLTEEYPNMFDARTITKLEDNTLDPKKTNGRITLPPRPKDFKFPDPSIYSEAFDIDACP